MSKTNQTISNCLCFVLLLMGSSCNQMSELYINDSAGFNGGFEVVKNGLPVNWQMYTPNTVPEGQFTILLDTVNPKEGKQSLKFNVSSCSANGGWHSPGFTAQHSVDENTTYILSCWVKNSGAEFAISAGGVSAMKGEMKLLIKDNQEYSEWTRLTFRIPVSSEFNELRIQFNVLKPGAFWIDNLQLYQD